MFRPLVVSCSFALVLVCVIAGRALAQTPPHQDLSTLSLEELMKVEVSTASKFPQAVKEAPASITIVTAQDIRRFGHRTLADVLRSVGGFYSTYDRNYTYIGMRGFARPGDYNTRVLLLIDGHRVNDGLYDMGPIGTDFIFDVALIDRVEVIRGPGSSLYGTNALFGVINVITKGGASRKGAQVDLGAGSLDTFRGLGSYGHVTGSGREVLVAASTYRSHGQDRIHIPAFGEDAVATDLDDDKALSVFGSLSAGRFSFHAGLTQRTKQVPTASFGTAFGDGREETSDDRGYIDGVYDGPIGKGWVATARVAYDYYYYEGLYPTPNEETIDLFKDESRSNSLTGELTARRRFGSRHFLTAGAEVRRDIENRLDAFTGTDQYLALDVPATKAGFYVQDEIRAASWLLVNAGLRVDRFTDFGTRVTPRIGAVVLPRTQTAIKLLHGRAFRAPNPYERYYYTGVGAASRGLDLLPEQIQSTEVVWEETLGGAVRVTAAAFAYDVKALIEQRSTIEGDIFFENAGRTRGRGLEAALEARLDNGVIGRVNHTFTKVTDRSSGEPVSNSPRHLSMVSVQAPLSKVVLALEGLRVGERMALDGSPVRGYFVPNVTLSSASDARIGFGLSVYNVFDKEYFDPGAEEHLQPQIRQDGRTVQLRINVRF